MARRPDTAEHEAHPEEGWVADAFDALDVGAVLFDAALTYRVSNRRWQQTFCTPQSCPAPGAPVADIARLVLAGREQDAADDHGIAQRAGELVDAIRAYVRDAEIQFSQQQTMLVTSTPTRDAGYLVTFRDLRRDRLAEQNAMSLLRDGFASVDMGMLLWDAGLMVRMANPAWSRLVVPAAVGETVESVGRRILAAGLVQPKPGLTPEQSTSEAIADAHRGPRQWEVHHPDGRVSRISTFPTQTGGVLAVAIDMSARHDAELRARELLNDAIESLGEGVMLLDSRLRMLIFNRAYGDLLFDPAHLPETGSTAREQIALSIEQGKVLVPEGETAAELIDRLETAVTDCAQNIFIPLRDDRFATCSVYPTEMGGYVVSIRDVTGAVRAEKAAREADELVRTIVEASPTTFLVTRLEDGKVIYAPPLSRQRFGDIETARSFFLDPQDRLKYLDALRKTGSLNDYPLRFRRGDGSIMDGLTSARIIQFRGEEMIVSSTRDITEHLAMQAELERQRELAHQNEKLSALGELLAGVAHELNNPLSVIVGQATMLQDRASEPDIARRVDKIAAAAHRSARIVKTFLAMARQRPAKVEICNINDIIETALELSAYGLQQGGARIVLRLDSALPNVEVDADQLVQVLSNLILNAQHALAGKGAEACLTIASRADQTGREVLVDVIDNGPGIPKPLQQRIFEPYFTTKDIGAGTGVGLAFCHRIVTAHGGRLTVTSTPGSGARFTIVLPGSRLARAADAETSALEPSGATRVLVLDDEEDVAELIGDFLLDAGYDVTIATAADAALRLCLQAPFDAIVSDVRMPGMDGSDFLQALSNAAPEQADRVGFLTGDTMGPGIASFLAGSGRPHVEKPASRPEILALVASLLEGGAP